MPLINLDFNLEDVSTEREILPPDQYEAKIFDAEATMSSNGNPMIIITWEIMDGEFAGRRWKDYVVLTVPWRVKQYAEVVGIESGTELDTEDFIGAEGIIEIVHEKAKDNDEIRAKIKSVKPLV